MAHTARKQARQTKRNRGVQEHYYADESQLTEPHIVRAEPLEAKTEKQRQYINAIKSHDIVFGTGPAGTGKTYIAAAIACDMLMSKRIDKIIITRPAVEAGESLGFLPGELEEKYEPYIAPFRDVLNERLGKSHVNNLLKLGRIEAVPFAYMRGKTFKNCMVILDEAQNATKEQMKLFLTRVGEGCKVVVDGDERQVDIRNSGLTDAIARLGFIPSIKVVRFGMGDIVRSGLCAEIAAAYEVELPDSPQ